MYVEGDSCNNGVSLAYLWYFHGVYTIPTIQQFLFFTVNIVQNTGILDLSAFYSPICVGISNGYGSLASGRGA